MKTILSFLLVIVNILTMLGEIILKILFYGLIVGLISFLTLKLIGVGVIFGVTISFSMLFKLGVILALIINSIHGIIELVKG